ncbi:MAG TPA: hypothetical protein VFR97_09845 [Capillimicrobium sp.]|nr:hypothetical protein [Capillimicrobium sp.]
MDSLAVVVLGAWAATFAIWLWVRAPHQRRPNERYGAERSYAAEAEVEESDIAEMIEARNAIRRRRGLPEIGDELVEQLRRDAAP